jgi:hypothetical protein
MVGWPRTTKTGLVIPCVENAYFYIGKEWKGKRVHVAGWGGFFIDGVRDSVAADKLVAELEICTQRTGWSLRACNKAVDRFIEERINA